MDGREPFPDKMITGHEVDRVESITRRNAGSESLGDRPILILGASEIIADTAKRS